MNATIICLRVSNMALLAQVMASWRLVLANDAFDAIHLEDVRVLATGNLVRDISSLLAHVLRDLPQMLLALDIFPATKIIYSSLVRRANSSLMYGQDHCRFTHLPCSMASFNSSGVPSWMARMVRACVAGFRDVPGGDARGGSGRTDPSYQCIRVSRGFMEDSASPWQRAASRFSTSVIICLSPVSEKCSRGKNGVRGLLWCT